MTDLARPNAAARWVARARAGRRAGPASFRGGQYVQIAVFTVLVALIAPALAHNTYTQTLVNLWLLYSLAALGFFVIFGLAGQFAFSQAFVMGVGAYVSAWVAKSHPTWVGLVVAVTVVGVISLAFALLTIRTSHFYFAIATFGLSSIGLLVIQQWPALGGSGGQVIGVPLATWFGRTFMYQEDVFWLFLAFLVLGLLVTCLLERSSIRREALALKDNELVAATLGVAVVKHRVATFVIGSCFGGVAGSLYAHWQTVLSTDAFGLNLGTGVFLMVVLGGLGSKWGAVIGAGFYVFVPQWLGVAVQYQQLLYGALLVVIMVTCPQGIIGALTAGARMARGLGRIRGAPRSSAEPVTAADEEAPRDVARR